MKTLLLICATFFSAICLAQNVGIGTNTPHASAMLEVSASNRGVLLTRVNLLSPTDVTTVASPATGLIVINTNGNTAQMPDSTGFYMWTGSMWAKFLLKETGSATTGWTTKGNAGINATTNFLGTTDNRPLVFRINNGLAGKIDTTGSISLGRGTLKNNPPGWISVAVGDSALYNNGIGAVFTTQAADNTAVGDRTLYANTTGSNNTAIGSSALAKNTATSGNTAIGAFSLSKNLSGSFNVASGNGALSDNTSGSYNAANGAFALQSNTTGQSNIAMGYSALKNNNNGSSNIAIGVSALYNNINRSNLVAIGDSALYNNGIGAVFTTQAADNTAVGDRTLYANTTGSNNTAIGSSALAKNTTTSGNTAIGAFSLSKNISGSFNIASGNGALSDNTSGSYNAANGAFALQSNTTGQSNIAMGYSALKNNNNGSYNIAIGHEALNSNAAGFSHIAIGTAALHSTVNDTRNIAIGDSASYNFNGTYPGIRNIAIGYKSLFANTTGENNSAIGNEALMSNFGIGNTAVGSTALRNNTFGGLNHAFGYQALYNNTTGNSNTAIGYSSLSTNTTGSSNTAIGSGSNVQSNALSNATAIGADAMVGASNSMVLGSINGINSATTDTKVGIGVTAPSEKLEIGNGRLRFKGNLVSSLAHGITWTNNAGTADKGFLGMETDNFLSFYNYGTSSWNIRIHTASGEMGINKQPLTSSNDSRLQVKQTGVQNGIGIESSANTNHWDWYVTTAASSDLLLYYNGSLKGTYGNAGGVYTPSDRRLKKDIALLGPALTNINKLEAYQYRYLDNSSADALSYGFMAQDIQKIFPDAVKETEMKDGEKRLGINYQYFTVLAIKGLQEQQKIIENLQSQIDEIKKLLKKD
ncbi:MAG: tail fiber domain-containing protein [Ferruginibacter sp.]|nr:tail fiber domain-containing protein [Ferruginibacter sp.]